MKGSSVLARPSQNQTPFQMGGYIQGGK
jgi:hypothetical protein